MNNKGLTLLEIMMTIVLLVLGVVPILNLYSTGMFVEANTKNSAIAVQLAQEKMEEIKDATSYANIDTFASARANIGGDFAAFDREVLVTTPAGPKQVNVNVYWTVQGQDQSVNLVSLFSDYDY